MMSTRGSRRESSSVLAAFLFYSLALGKRTLRPTLICMGKNCASLAFRKSGRTLLKIVVIFFFFFF